MDLTDAVARLAATADAIASLARNVSEEEAHFKPAPDAWSVVEVVNHLYDEERDDFRARLRMTLEDPKQLWPRTDPPGWVVEHRYSERDLAPSLDAWLAERRASLEWLKSLGDADWTLAHRHPAGFTISAGDLLAAWVGHDLLHVRQLTELRWAYLALAAAPYSVEYAGEW